MIDSRRPPRFGDVWRADLEPIVGHEQGGIRPVVLVSADALNEGSSRLAIVVVVTRTYRGSPFHVEVMPPNGGLKHRGFALCEMVRSISTDRMQVRIGALEQSSMDEITYRLRVLLDL